MLTHPEEQRQKADPTEPAARLGKGGWGERACLGGQYAPQSQGFLPIYRGGLKGPIFWKQYYGCCVFIASIVFA